MAKKLLTISLLVSNRIDTIEKCLSSLKPIIDALDADLIVVDTVGEEKTDGSLVVAKKYTDKIIHFDWINDFAAARNVGIDAADSEWFMFIDDDEWFESTDEIIKFFKSGEYLEYNCANYAIRNYSDYNGHFSRTQISRMFKMGDGIRFFGAIHEKLNVDFSGAKCLKDYVHHYGYAFKTYEDYVEHVMRNRPILEEQLAKDPDNLSLCCQYMVEIASSSPIGELYSKSKKFAEKFVIYKGNPAYSLILSYYFSYMIDKDLPVEEYEAEHKKYYKIGEISSIMPPILDFYLGKFYMKKHLYMKAIHQFERYRAGVYLVKERVKNYEALLVGFNMAFYDAEVWNESLYLQAQLLLSIYPIDGYVIEGFDQDDEMREISKKTSSEDKRKYQDKAITLFSNIIWNDEIQDLFQYMRVFFGACLITKKTKIFEDSVKLYIDSDKTLFLVLRVYFDMGAEIPEYLLDIDISKIKKFVEHYPSYVECAKKYLSDRKKTLEIRNLREQLLKEIQVLKGMGKNEEAASLIKEAEKLGIKLS